MTGLLWGYQTIVKRTLSYVRERLGDHLLDRFRVNLGDASAGLTSLRARRATLLVALFLLGGCAGANVAVQSTRLPVPIVDPLPVSLGIHLSDELRTYVHEETIANTGSFRISIGSAQDLMFENLASGLFSSHRFVATPNDHAADIDAILVPSIDELQFSIPKQTKSDFFEVWLKYNFELLSPDGTTIAEWPMKAYGRANSRNYGFLEDTDNGGLQEASRVALRDAMALFTFKFQRVPEVQQWLNARNNPDEPLAAAADIAADLQAVTSGAIDSESAISELAQPEPSQTEGN